MFRGVGQEKECSDGGVLMSEKKNSGRMPRAVTYEKDEIEDPNRLLRKRRGVKIISETVKGAYENV